MCGLVLLNYVNDVIKIRKNNVMEEEEEAEEEEATARGRWAPA